MARYYFHTQTDSRATDGEGVECARPLEARAHAIEMCGELMKSGADAFWGSRPWSIIVTDAAGLILWEIEVNGYASPATSAIV